MKKRKDVFKKVIAAIDKEGCPISVKNRFFVSAGDIRAAEKLMDDVVKTGAVEKDNLRTGTFFLISEENAKKLRVIEENIKEAKKTKKTKKK
jgi:hypothetical protein